MSFKQSQEVINDYEKLLESDEEYNVIIHAGENENVEVIHGHSNILRIRSQYFRTAFSNELTEKKDGKFIFIFPNILPQFFKIILRFIYCGKIDLTKLQILEVLKLLIVVDELKIQTLILYINEYLIQHREFLKQNPIEILDTVYQIVQNDIFSEICDYCLEEICIKPEKLFKSDKILTLKTPLLELLLKWDHLFLDEIVIWEGLIKWCLAQHPNISKDPTQWNNEEIMTMERIIHRFIPSIRFYHIPSTDFITKVYPFKKVIPEDLIDNVLVYHMAPDKRLNVDIQPPRKPKIIYDSIIINKKKFAIISSWIEKKNQYYNEKNIPYEFNLIYRASRDGYTNTAFHEKCDNKGATIVVIKITNSEQIVGGYNPLFWDSSNTFISTCDSFLFSFTNNYNHKSAKLLFSLLNKDNLQSAKVGYSNGDSFSISCDPDYGPAFGGGNDLCFSSGTYYNNTFGGGGYLDGRWYSNINVNSSYPNIGIPVNFKADDFEVFQVIKSYKYDEIIKKRLLRNVIFYIVYFVTLFTVLVISDKFLNKLNIY
ncbi:hypothetical protein C1646_812616 [Rhizophagus diaphanus]|nr:hypothetical protein C1646_812616 [Rhizophagus diaphanus] [Rhizophagus sp. MUCL 43196]